MNTNQFKFGSSDAWLLQSIAQGGGSVFNIIAIGDMIDHSIITYAELQTGLAKLLAAGIIEVKEDKFGLSPTFAEVFVRIAKRHGMTAHRTAIEKYLQVIPREAGYDPNILDPNWLYPGVAQEDFDKALQEYYEIWSRILKKNEAKRVRKKKSS